jgi:hypothetical protein
MNIGAGFYLRPFYFLYIHRKLNRKIKMNSREFCYWLQGLFEVGEPETLDAKQVDLIKRHLNMVFVHEIDPSYPKEHQDKLNQAHEGISIPHNSSLLDGKPVAMRC